MPNEASAAVAASTETVATLVVGKGAEDLIAKHINIERPNIVMKDATFAFRKFKNELGEEVKKDAVKLQIPVLTIDGLVEALADPKVQEFFLDLAADAIKQAARVQVDAEDNPVEKQEQLDLTKLTIEYLANQPKAERTGGGISKETWTAWGVDYMETMQLATPEVKEENIKAALTIFLKRYSPIKYNKPVLKKLRERLAIYATNTKQLEEFAEVFEYLDKRAETLINSDDSALLENL